MNRKERLKVLERIAQTTGQQGAPQASTAPPPASPAASTLFPSVAVGWDSSRVPYINRIISRLDAAVGLGTQGKYTFKILWDNKFPAGVESEFTSPVKDVLVLLRRAFINFLNNGVVFQKPLNTGEIIPRVNALLNSAELAKLQEVNPAGPLGKAGVSLPSIRQDLMNMMPAANAR
jgi:hypothetical protein